MNQFWSIVLSNALVATLLAIGAALLARLWKNPAAIHVLWLVVLLKLFTPPLITAELPFASAWQYSSSIADATRKILPGPGLTKGEQLVVVTQSNHPDLPLIDQPYSSQQTTTIGRSATPVWPRSTLLPLIWIIGSGSIAVIYAISIHRFSRLVQNLDHAPSAIRLAVAQIAERVGLQHVPDVFVTARPLPPLVWSIGFSPRLILPSELFSRLSPTAQATILAHELVHVSRRDHLVRFLELAATTVFWWHPVVWWACRQLRDLEEQCCDSRVLELVPHQSRVYATTLVDTLDFLSEQSPIYVPLPTAVHSTGSLTRRIRMLTRRQSNRLTSRSTLCLALLIALPMAITFAADPAPKVKTPAAVLSGLVRNDAGQPLAGTVVRVAIPATDMRFVNPYSGHKQFESKTDKDGKYRLEIPELAEPTMISVDAMQPGYRKLVGTLMRGGSETKLKVTAGEVSEANLTLNPALYFAGKVVDQQGNPIPGVEIAANANTTNASGGVERTASNSDGSFELFNYSAEPETLRGSKTRGAVHFSHPKYLSRDIDDVYALTEGERKGMRIVLRSGYKASGTLVDVTGKPVPNVMLKTVLGNGTHRKAVMTDANGKFAFYGLGKGPTRLSALSMEINQKIQLPILIDSDKADLVIQLQAISLPAKLKSFEVLGMQLTDATPALQKAYELSPQGGALIVDPGKNSDRLEIGRLAKGYHFWIVGNDHHVNNVREFVTQILAETDDEDAKEFSVRVVYSLSTLEFDGTNTQYLKLTKDDIKQLKLVLKQLEKESK